MKPPALERNDTWGDRPDWRLSGKGLPARCEKGLIWLLEIDACTVAPVSARVLVACVLWVAGDLFCRELGKGRYGAGG